MIKIVLKIKYERLPVNPRIKLETSSASKLIESFLYNRALWWWCTADKSVGIEYLIFEVIWWSKSCISCGKDGSVVPNQVCCKRSMFFSNSTVGLLPLCIVLVNAVIRKVYIYHIRIVQSPL